MFMYLFLELSMHAGRIRTVQLALVFQSASFAGNWYNSPF